LLVVPVTIAGVGAGSPETVLNLAPYWAEANAEVALRSLASATDRGPVQEAGAKALKAYMRDPTRVGSVAALGLIAAVEGRNDQALAIFQYAQQLSRRNATTQLWLIEERVQKDDIEGALHHYDLIFRTSDSLKSSLDLILNNASSDPVIATELNELLRERPPWRLQFLWWVLGATGDANALAALARGALDGSDPKDREFLTRLLPRLVELERDDLAWQAYQEVAPEAAKRLLRDGDFRQGERLPPFEWHYSEEGQLAPERRPHDAKGSYALMMPTASLEMGTAAKQMLKLSPGRYRLDALVGDVPADRSLRPAISITCLKGRGAALATTDFPEAQSDGVSMTLIFAVPERCNSQWLSLDVKGSLDAQSGLASPWITAVSLRRI